jgi:TFIIF-interacting CTD phosphatase-like protein
METRMNVLLDLDNTLINTLEEDERMSIPLAFQDKFDHKDMLPFGMRIYARPGLQEFLDYLFENFNVSVFTAAEQEYALFIIKNFLLTKPNRKVQYIFFRYHVDMTLQRYDGTKDLRLLFNIFRLPNFYPCNTVIIDDLDDVHKANPHHAIAIASFDVTRDNKINYESVNDNDLSRVQSILETLRAKFEASPCVRQIYFGYTPTVESPFFL